MRRFKNRTRRNSVGSLDSFLDVVCNLIGGLLLICLVSALSANSEVFEVFTPVEDVGSQDMPVYFVVTERGIYPLQRVKAIKSIAEKLKSETLSGDFVHETEYFKWTLFRRSTVSILKNKPAPINSKNLGSMIELISHMDKMPQKGQQYFAAFLVAPSDEAFRLFRLARRTMYNAQIKTGWEPHDPSEPLTFVKKGGRRTVPQ